jgi:Zn-dependent protease
LTARRCAAKEPVSFSRVTLSSERLLLAVASLIPMLFSLSVHECAHAWSAYRLGDDTAARMGRLTLNPLPHIDLLGTIILPLLAIMNPSIPFFGWAKPVPINPLRFRRDVSMGRGMALTAAAGPLSNVLLAILSATIYGLGLRFGVLTDQPALLWFLQMMMELNIVLALFNLIPVPPLDGSRFIDWLAPSRLRPAWEKVQQFSPFLLLGLLYAAPQILGRPFAVVSALLTRFLLLVAGQGA